MGSEMCIRDRVVGRSDRRVGCVEALDHFVVEEGLPELEVGRALQLLACSLAVIDARQLNLDTPASDLLNVWLCHAQVVDTLADDAFGVVNRCGALVAENGEDFVFRGLRREQILAFHVVEDAP